MIGVGNLVQADGRFRWMVRVMWEKIKAERGFKGDLYTQFPSSSSNPRTYDAQVVALSHLGTVHSGKKQQHKTSLAG